MLNKLIKTTVVLLAIAFMGFLLSEQSSAQGNYRCRPGIGQVAIYEHRYYDGRCAIVGPGVYTMSNLPIRNDTASSVLVGDYAVVMLCKGDRFQGGCENVYHDDPSLGNNRVGHDTLSSMKVKYGGPFCRPGPYQVSIFEDYNYTGNCAVLDIGSYYSISRPQSCCVGDVNN